MFNMYLLILSYYSHTKTSSRAPSGLGAPAIIFSIIKYSTLHWKSFWFNYTETVYFHTRLGSGVTYLSAAPAGALCRPLYLYRLDSANCKFFALI